MRNFFDVVQGFRINLNFFNDLRIGFERWKYVQCTGVGFEKTGPSRVRAFVEGLAVAITYGLWEISLKRRFIFI
jgi:hypothetical protein